MNNPNPHEPFHLLITDSIQRFHSERRSGVSNFDGLTSVYSRIIQTTPDPPLELLWFYSAVTFRRDKLEVLKRVALVKELFGLMVSCTAASATSSKKVAALAPVVYELHRLVGDVMFWFFEALDEVRCLIDGVVSYVSMCCYKDERGFSVVHRFSPLLMDVVGVFLADKAQADIDQIGVLRLFFPVVMDEVRARIRDGREIDFLAGTVMCEVFLLSLSLKCSTETPRADLQKDLYQHAFQVIAGFRDLNFFGELLLAIPEILASVHVSVVAKLLGHAGESLLREVLYDVAMTTQDSSLLPIIAYQLPGDSTDVALRWLLMVEKASQCLRASGDETKALSFASAFFESSITGQLIEWAIQKTGTSRPVVSSPAALVRWFLAIEEHGLKLSNDRTLHTQLQGVASDSACGHDGLPTNTDTQHVTTTECNESSVQEMADSTSDSFTLFCMSTCFDGQRKRKEDRQDNAYHRAKFIKVHCHGNYGK